MTFAFTSSDCVRTDGTPLPTGLAREVSEGADEEPTERLGATSGDGSVATVLAIFEGPDARATVVGVGAEAGLFCLSFFCDSVFLLSGFSGVDLVLEAATGAVGDDVAGVVVELGTTAAAGG